MASSNSTWETINLDNTTNYQTNGIDLSNIFLPYITDTDKAQETDIKVRDTDLNEIFAKKTTNISSLETSYNVMNSSGNEVDLSKVFEPYNNIDPQIGLVIIWPAITLLPSVLDEYLVCDGTGYNPTDPSYVDLFNVIGYNYGRETVPGSMDCEEVLGIGTVCEEISGFPENTPDYFRVPDLSDKTIVMNTNDPPSYEYYGTDSTFNEGISINEENMPAHSHSISGSIADHTHEFGQVKNYKTGEDIVAYATYWAFGGVNNIPVSGGNYRQILLVQDSQDYAPSNTTGPLNTLTSTNHLSGSTDVSGEEVILPITNPYITLNYLIKYKSKN
jgi:microcystin-dependent protein